MKRKLTKDQILQIAKSVGYFSLHRYRYIPPKVRERLKLLLREDKLEYAGYWLSHDHYKVKVNE